MKSAGNWIKKKSHRVGHFRIKVQMCPDTGFYGWDTSELRFGSVLWTLQNLNSEVSYAYKFTLAAMPKFTLFFLECIMFITKYLIVKNICILYLLIW